MPGGYGRDESTPWGSSGTSSVSTRSQAPPGRDPGGSHTGGRNLGYQAPSSGGSDDYGIGSGGEFGASNQAQQDQWSQRAREQEKQDRVQAQMQQNALDAARREREEKDDT